MPRTARGWLVGATIAAAIAHGCAPGWSEPAPARATATRRVLPAPSRSGGASLAAVLTTRRSARAFGARALGDVELGQLLWAAQGVVDGHRTAPSAGALYPLTITLADATGVWRYLPDDHALVRAAAGDARDALATAAGGQGALRAAPAVLVISARIAITARKYGDRAERYATLEAGHAAENALLTATALGLAAVPIGAFDDGDVRRAAGLPDDATPLYLIPVGAPP